MNLLIEKFYSPKESGFKEVIFLSEESEASFEDLCLTALDLPRAWYELSRISARDRVEFTREFWLDRIPYHPAAHPLFFAFFEKLSDVMVVLTRSMENEPMDAELVYSLRDGSSFFRGRPPCESGELMDLEDLLQVNLPRDFLSFLRIHDGFGKLSEMGLIEALEIPETKRRVMDRILKSEKRIFSGNKEVDPGSLIPFFEALGLSSFQCFYKDWYPGSEMGNVYFSGIEDTVSDISDKKTWMEKKAFSSFSEWLAHYLLGMDLCI